LHRTDLIRPDDILSAPGDTYEMENVTISRRKYGDAERMNQRIEIYGVMPALRVIID
jgi:hypothetical protein